MEKIALVTGASRGIGREIALNLAKKGYKVTHSYLFILNPSVTACAVPAPRAGSLLGATTIQKLSPFTGKVSRHSRDERGKARRC